MTEMRVSEREWYATPQDEALSLLSTDTHTGLSAEEAEKRVSTYGRNELKETPPPTLLALFIGQLREVLVLMLIGAAVISSAVGEWADALVIVLIVLLNAALGVYQERRAEKAMEALKQLSQPVAKVLRNGVPTSIHSAELVPGDIVFLEAGDFVPADLRLLEAASLKVNESALTGESVAVDKETSQPHGAVAEKLTLGDQHNMAFMGTVVTYGRGRGVVVRTGMLTEIGRVATLIQAAPQEATPLQKRLEELGKTLGLVAVVLVVIVFVTGLLRGEDAFEMFMTAISLAVAAVPEGLPAVVTIVLALGVQRMSRRNAIIRRLPAVETLGAATIICSDKTGTLTRNEMTVVQAYADGKVFAVAPEGPVDAPPAAAILLQAGVLASDAQVDESNGQTKIIGDPTEGALVVAAQHGGYNPGHLTTQLPRVSELPFDSARKMMTTVHNWEHDGMLPVETPYLAFTKGAPDVLLSKCNTLYRNNQIISLTSEHRRNLDAINTRFAGEGLRVLAVAFRTWSNIPDAEPAEVEKQLTFLGYFAMQDPPREEARSAVHECRLAGIHPVMITGDHKDTALAIARNLGIWEEGHQVLTGAELEAMSDDDLRKVVEQVSVYARVSPEHKLRIVDAYKAHDHVVAMTGDGVNDAPALKRADIGAAMGITGTAVAKEAADMVLADDNFATIVSAVAAGRTIFANIRKVVHYLLSCNTGEIAAIFFAIALGLGRPLTAIQILWLNLVTDGLPALALGVEPAEVDVMQRPPRRTREGVLGGGLGVTILWQGVLIGGLTLLGFWTTLRMGRPLEEARTVAFLTLSLSQIVHSFNARSLTHSVFSLGITRNRPLLLATAASVVLQLAVVLLPPLQSVFQTVPLPAGDWLQVIILSLMPLVVVEIAKAFKRNK